MQYDLATIVIKFIYNLLLLSLYLKWKEIKNK